MTVMLRFSGERYPFLYGYSFHLSSVSIFFSKSIHLFQVNSNTLLKMNIFFAGVEIQCIGHFKLLFSLLRLENFPEIQKMTLRVLSNVTGSSECIDDISASHVLVALLQVMHSNIESQELSLSVFQSLMGDTRLVKEALARGKTKNIVEQTPK